MSKVRSLEEAAAMVPDGATIGERLRAASRYAFGPLLDDLTPWLLIGFTISALIAVAIPDDLFVETVPAGWPSMLLMMVVATPVYICATASTPIAASASPARRRSKEREATISAKRVRKPSMCGRRASSITGTSAMAAR